MENKQVDPEAREKLLELVSLVFDLNQKTFFKVALEIKGYLLSDSNEPYFDLRIVGNSLNSEYFCAASPHRQYDALSYSTQPACYDNLVRAITWLKRKNKEDGGLKDLIARLQDIPEYWRCEDFDDCPHIEDFKELLERRDKLTADEPSYKNSRAWEAWAEQHDYLSDVIGEIKNQYEDFQNV